ncbi:MAG TPA: nitrile hydratase subunit alpha [Gammaproteobacteria bacterium]|nr:nitrile hydratase subunit alpha [Gammaproteobacteria bacterium]
MADPQSIKDFSRHPDLAHLPSDPALRVKAMESLLLEKGLVKAETINACIEKFEKDVGPHNGARVVARAWVDPDFKARLLGNATEAVGEMGYIGNQTTDIVAVENTSRVHNLVVCTLCSCYPWTLLGLPPPWYKSFAYRSRVVREPREVLKEFGVEVGEDVSVRVWDSTAEVRYLVIPERPAGTERMTETELAGIVTRDSMIGAARL